MEIKALNVIRIVIGAIGFLYCQDLFAQEDQKVKIVNEEKFLIAMKANISNIFSINPYGNVDSVKYESYYAVLRIRNGMITELTYPDDTEPFVIGKSDFAIKNFNERIKKGEFKFENIDQIIIPAIIEWVHFETNEPQLYKALLRILPQIGYTSNTYVLPPYLLYRGNPIIN